MLLKKVTIHKYKSFLTEQTYEVENQITRIVGKNESGKTALLEALAKSNYFENNPEFQFNKDLDYPRSELIRVRNENPKAITCEYELILKIYSVRKNTWFCLMEHLTRRFQLPTLIQISQLCHN